ncbi:MAG TPA: hypothetical protein VLT82_07250 [Myxococcaceae bacterium]|nr:hypothetical protein [Myxococcaceae bacterium]
MVRSWKRGVVLLGFMAGLQSAGAQQFVLPQTLAVSNRDRIFPGLYEFSEAGAVVARVRDASATWYNPAGLALSERTTFNVSSAAYQLTMLGSANAPAEFTRTASFQPIPSALGVAFGKEVLEWHGLRLGLGIHSQANWDSSVRLESNPSPDTRVSYVMKSLFRSTVFTAGAGWALDPRFRFGAALLFDYTETGDVGQTSADTQDGTALQTVIQSLDFSGNTLHLMATLGAQAEPLPWLSLGLVVQTPGIALAHGGTVRYEAQTSTLQTHSLALIDDSNAEFDLRKTFKATLGIGVRFWKIELEGDLRWYPASATYTLFATSVPIQITTQLPGQAPVVTEEQFASIAFATRQVWSGSIGLQLRLSELVTFHGGFYLDPSPLGTAVNGVFQRADFAGFRGGVSFTARQGLSGSVSLGYERGTADTTVAVGGLAVTPLPVEISFTTFNVSFAIGYKF